MTKKAALLLACLLAVITATSWFFMTGKKKNIGMLDGGPCEYDTLVLPAKVIGIDYSTDSLADILLEIKARPEMIDTFYYSRQYPYKNLTKAAIKKAGVHTGDILACTCYKIREGYCSPYIYIPSLEKFKEGSY